MAEKASAPGVALFRAREDANASAAALAARGFRAALAPVLEFAATGAAPPAGPFDFVIATSAKAFDLLAPAALGLARNLPLYVVGEHTAAAARRLGLAAQATVADIAALPPTLPDGRALYLAGRDRKPLLEAALGARAVALVVYEAQARDNWDAAEAQAVGAAAAALHYSRRSAELAARCAERAGLAETFRLMPHVCLSRDAAAPLARLGVARALWPRAPEEAALLDALESALADSNRG